MNNKVLALAVAAALVSPVAMAETTLYGNIDVSIDHIQQPTSDVGGFNNPTNAEVTDPINGVPTPVIGPTFSTNQLSSNTSYVGIRGSHDIAPGLKGLYQVETEANVVSTPATPNGLLASRNSYVGLGGAWGAVKAGKNDTPYKTSTGSLDPFSTTVGDYNAIFGNTGGDNRTEFDERLPHSIWYESPKYNNFQFNVLLSPGQHLNGFSSGIAQGEGKPSAGTGTCSGGNAGAGKESNGGFANCTDGGQGTTWSADVIYKGGPLYLTAAYELKKDVDRTGDDFGNAGIRDESAIKIGGGFDFANTNRVTAIYEKLRRNNATPGSFVFNGDPNTTVANGTTVGTGPGGLSGSAGRNKSDYYLSDTQKLPGNNEIMVAWAHSGKSDRPDGADDQANLYAIGAAHHFNKWMKVYAVYAEDRNHIAGHYGLGQAGHGIQVDPSGTGGDTFKAFSIGTDIKF